MDGFLIVDKEKGWTSHDVVSKARGVLGTRKIGHLGTLDPNATGVLVLALGRATKMVSTLIGCDKDYEAELRLGAVSSTYDSEGDIEAHAGAEPVSREAIEGVLDEFRGTLSQMPPAFSAIKIGGRRAYELARQGKVPELKPRTVTIHRLEFVSYEWSKLQLFVSCSSGTYIRSLVHDIGMRLGCGAYLSELRRTRVGNFLIDGAHAISHISKEYLLSISDIVNSNEG